MPTSNSTLCADDHRYDHPLSLQSIWASLSYFQEVSSDVVLSHKGSNQRTTTQPHKCKSGPATISNCYLRLWPARSTDRPIRAQHENRNASAEANRPREM